MIRSFLFLFVAGLFLGGMCYTFTLDETFVTLRYADNLANGYGAVFNFGERVEGFFSPLWVLLLALLSFLPGDLVLYAKALSFAFYLGVGAYLLKMIQREGGSLSLTTIFYLLSFPLILWGVSGLESSLYALLYLMLFNYTTQIKKMSGWKLGVLLIAILLTRPEAIPICLISLAVYLTKKRISVKFMTYFVISVVTLLLVRINYFGDLLPHVFYAKQFNSPKILSLLFIHYFLGYFMGPGFIFALLGVVCWKWMKPHRVYLMILFVAGHLLPYVYSGGDGLTAWRIFVPVIPIFILMINSLLSEAKKNWNPLTTSAAFSLFIFLYFVGNISLLRQYSLTHWKVPTLASIRGHVDNGNPNFEKVATWLNHNKKYIRSIAVGEQGYFGYYTGIPCLDLRGVTNKTIGLSHEFPNSVVGKKLPLYQNGFSISVLGQYILAQNPDLIIVSKQSTLGARDFLLDGSYYKVKEIGNFQIYARSLIVESLDLV